jgi:predicted aspartyl protease
MNPRLCLLWATLVLLQSGFAQIPQSALPISDHNPPRATSRFEIPFKLYQDYLIVMQGSLGSLERLNFLIDTGVNPTVVDRRIAKKLRLTGGTHALALFNQNTDVRSAVLANLQLGPIRAESLPVMIQDLSHFEQALGVPIDAMVGFGVLNLSSFSIDYRSKKNRVRPCRIVALCGPFRHRTTCLDRRAAGARRAGPTLGRYRRHRASSFQVSTPWSSASAAAQRHEANFS